MRLHHGLRACSKPIGSIAVTTLLGGLGLLGGAGCISVPSKIENPTPAAEGDALDRPFLAPLELTEDPLQDAIVRVVGSVSCTGTLIDEDLVLTAHHCVAARSSSGKILERDLDAADLHIELGGDDLPWGEVGVRHVVTPACGYQQGAGDIAVLVLNRKLIGMPTFSPRLSKAPAEGEEVSPWGFGRCANSGGTVRRQTRAGGTIETVAPGLFRATAAICPGDSGGPVLNNKREVVGVVSAAVMDNDAATRDRSYFARIDKFEQLLSAARELADGATSSELPPYRSCEAVGQTDVQPQAE